MAGASKKHVSNIVRFVVCAAALWFVLRGVTSNDRVVLRDGGTILSGTVTEADGGVRIDMPDGRERFVKTDEIARDDQGKIRIEYGLKTAWRNSRGVYLLIATLVLFPVTFLQGIRLQWLLRAQKIHVPYWECLKLSFAGNFLNFATPLGSNAGDVFKAVVVTAHTDQKTEAATTIALDRAIGLGTLLVCVGAITTFYTAEGRLAELRPYVLTFLGVGVAIVLAYLSPVLRPLIRMLVPKAWVESAAESSVMGHVRRIDRAGRDLARQKTIVMGAVGFTVLLQATALTAYFLVAVALQLDAHLGNMLEYYAYFYTGTVVQALPGPPQGLGTVELAYRYFFAVFGSPSQIVCMAFMIRVMTLVCALPGLLVTLTGSYKPRTTPLRAVPAGASNAS